MKTNIYLAKLIIVSIINVLPLKSNAQSDYIATDSTYTMNVKLIVADDITNSEICRAQKGIDIIEYKPDDITEYGFTNGKVYVSKEIKLTNKTKKVFLERLIKGKVTLYFYKNKRGKYFFIEKKSGQLIEIKNIENEAGNQAFELILSNNLKDCELIQSQINSSRYTKKSLYTLIENYNHCSPTFDSFKKFGLLIGSNISSYKNKAEIYTNRFLEPEFKLNLSLHIGLFMDIPFNSSKYLFHPEIYFTKNSYSNKNSLDGAKIDIMLSSINIPLLIRRVFPNEKAKPFITFGPVIKYNFVKKEDILDNSAIFQKPKIMSLTQFGYALGIGYEIPNNYHPLFFEIRHSSISSFDNGTKGTNKFYSFSISFDL